MHCLAQVNLGEGEKVGDGDEQTYGQFQAKTVVKWSVAFNPASLYGKRVVGWGGAWKMLDSSQWSQWWIFLGYSMSCANQMCNKKLPNSLISSRHVASSCVSSQWFEMYFFCGQIKLRMTDSLNKKWYWKHHKYYTVNNILLQDIFSKVIG